MVLALLPVIGIPLPLVSYGGSALLPSLVALGLLVGFARREPEAARALAAPRAAPARRPPGRRSADAGHSDPDARPPRRRWHRRPHLAPARDRRRPAPARPVVEITCLGTPRGLETRVVPEAGYPLELIPPVPLPRRPTPTCCGSRAGCAARSRRRWRSSTGSGRTWWSATAATSRCRPTSPRARRKLPLVVHEQNALPGLANKAGARIADRVAVSFPDTAAAAAEYVGLPIRRMICQPRPGRAARRGPRVLRPRPRPPDAAGHRRLAGRPQHQPGRLRRRPGARRRRRPGAARRRAQGRGGARRPPARRTSWCRFVDRMDLAYAAADLVVCRAGASSVTEAAAARAAGDLRAAPDRQRRAGAQRPSRRRGRGRGDGPGRRSTVAVTRAQRVSVRFGTPARGMSLVPMRANSAGRSSSAAAAATGDDRAADADRLQELLREDDQREPWPPRR